MRDIKKKNKKKNKLQSQKLEINKKDRYLCKNQMTHAKTRFHDRNQKNKYKKLRENPRKSK
jgi:hypothetical protein